MSYLVSDFVGFERVQQQARNMGRGIYRGDLPKPDASGCWRPYVGKARGGSPTRFTVGNRRDISEGEARRRLEAIRDLFDQQCAKLGISHWHGDRYIVDGLATFSQPRKMTRISQVGRSPRGVPLATACVGSPSLPPASCSPEYSAKRTRDRWNSPNTENCFGSFGLDSRKR